MSGRKLHETPLEFGFEEEPFQLVWEQTDDGVRVQRELDEAAASKAEQEKAQARLPLEAPQKQP